MHYKFLCWMEKEEKQKHRMHMKLFNAEWIWTFSFGNVGALDRISTFSSNWWEKVEKVEKIPIWCIWSQSTFQSYLPSHAYAFEMIELSTNIPAVVHKNNQQSSPSINDVVHVIRNSSFYIIYMVWLCVCAWGSWAYDVHSCIGVTRWSHQTILSHRRNSII